MRTPLLALVLLALSLPARADVPPVPPTAEDRSVSVAVDAPKRMKVHPRKGLRGKITVTIRNGTEATVELVDPEILGLVFRDPATGDHHVIPHSCFCVLALSHPEQVPTITIAPGEAHTMVFDDFGCGGGPWPTPPKGTYWVSYQLHPASIPHALRNRDPLEGSPPQLTDACTELVTSTGYATDTLRSRSVEVTLH